MFNLLVILILITAVLLILAVLVQNSKKEGLSSPLGDSSASQLIGVTKTSDLLEQITWGLIVMLFVLTLSTSLFLGEAGDKLLHSPNIERAQEQAAPADSSQSEDAPTATPAPQATENQD